MKKFIILLLICLSSLSFSDVFSGWRVISQRDEFGDLTGKVGIACPSKNLDSMVGFQKRSNKYYGEIYCEDYIGGVGANRTSVVKFKVDDLKPIEFRGNVVGGNTVKFNLEKNKTLFEQMKKGTLLRVSVEKYDQTKLLYKFDLKDFTKVFNENIK